MQAKSFDLSTITPKSKVGKTQLVQTTVIRNTFSRDSKHPDTVIQNTFYRDLKHHWRTKHRDLKHFLVIQLPGFTDKFTYVICYLNVQINNNQSGCFFGWGKN